MGENNDDVEYHLIDPRICFNPTTLVSSTAYYGNVISLTGQPRIGLRDRKFCTHAPYNCVLVLSTEGSTACWHFACSACADELLRSNAPVCPVCQRRIHIPICINFS